MDFHRAVTHVASQKEMKLSLNLPLGTVPGGAWTPCRLCTRRDTQSRYGKTCPPRLGRHLVVALVVMVSIRLAGQECGSHVEIQGKLAGQGLVGELGKIADFNLETVIQGDVRQKEKSKHPIFTHICGI